MFDRNGQWQTDLLIWLWLLHGKRTAAAVPDADVAETTVLLRILTNKKTVACYPTSVHMRSSDVSLAAVKANMESQHVLRVKNSYHLSSPVLPL